MVLLTLASLLTSLLVTRGEGEDTPSPPSLCSGWLCPYNGTELIAVIRVSKKDRNVAVPTLRKILIFLLPCPKGWPCRSYVGWSIKVMASTSLVKFKNFFLDLIYVI